MVPPPQTHWTLKHPPPKWLLKWTHDKRDKSMFLCQRAPPLALYINYNKLLCTSEEPRWAWWRSRTSGSQWWAWRAPEPNLSGRHTSRRFLHSQATTRDYRSLRTSYLRRITSLMVFWLRARMISADAPRTKARFIFNKTNETRILVSFYIHTVRNWIPACFCSNSLSYFIDHSVCERLLVSGGSFVVVHVHGHDPDPRLLVFGHVFTFSSAHPSVLVLDLQPHDRLDTWAKVSLCTLFSKSC